MINSRSISDLLPQVQPLANAFIEKCKAVGIDVLITSTYRDKESQAALFAQGRTTPGKIVTNARAGQSFHNYRVAFDIVPLVNGKPVWDTNNENAVLWKKCGAIGVECGLEWAGNWRTFKEFPHFQFTGGLTLADFQAGKVLA